MLTHRNLVANMLQARSAIGEHLTDGEELVIAPVACLPHLHLYRELLVPDGNRQSLAAHHQSSRFAQFR